MTEIKLTNTLKHFQPIDIVDALDAVLGSYPKTNKKGESKAAKSAHKKIIKLLRKDMIICVSKRLKSRNI